MTDLKEVPDEQVSEGDAGEPAKPEQTIQLNPQFLINKLQSTVASQAINVAQQSAAIEQLVQEKASDQEVIAALRAKVVMLVAQVPKKPVVKNPAAKKRAAAVKKKASSKKTSPS